MIRLLHLIFLFLVLTKLNGQPPEFSIIGPGGAISEVSIIAGTSLLLSTNYDEIRGVNVLFPDNHRTSSDVPYEIGFPFVFYEAVYTEYFIGANGYITFENPPWNPAPTLDTIPYNISNPDFPRNSIFGTFKGWDVVGGNNVSRLTLGEEPNRMLIVTWCDVPALQSDSTGTFQIILHESGEIDIHLIKIPFSNYAGNFSTVGIQASNPFQGLVAPQRIYGPWPPVSSESWKFTWLNSDYEVESINHEPVPVAEHLSWYRPDAFETWVQTSNEKQVTVKPKTNTRYLAEVTSCWGEVIATAGLFVEVEGSFPNAFSPNSPIEKNRTFKMPVTSGINITDFRLEVYNRWGQLVFETNDPTQGWNGRMMNTGEACLAGLYHWILISASEAKGTIGNSGAVMLLR
jgi:hypothetical protein